MFLLFQSPWGVSEGSFLVHGFERSRVLTDWRQEMRAPKTQGRQYLEGLLSSEVGPN